MDQLIKNNYKLNVFTFRCLHAGICKHKQFVLGE